MSEPLTARDAIARLYELGFGKKDTDPELAGIQLGSGFSQAASLLLKANVDGQAERDGITVIAHKVIRDDLPNGCIGTVVEARYEIIAENEPGTESVDSLDRFGNPE